MMPQSKWCQNQQHVRSLNNKLFNLVGHTHPSILRVIEWCQKEEATVRTIFQQDAVGNPPVKRTKQRHVQLQERLQNLCRPHYWPEDHCRVLVWSWVEHQTQSQTLVLKRQLTLWTSTFNVCMFIIISLWFDIFHMLFVIWLINGPIIDVIN